MKLPAFNEFLDTISLEDCNSWCTDIENDLKSLLEKEGRTVVNLSDTVTAASALNMKFLREYHEWLSKQLEVL